MFYFDIKSYYRYWTVYLCIWEKSYVRKKIDILMSHGKNALKLPEDHIDCNLNLKIIL